MALTKVNAALTDLNQVSSENGLRMPTGTPFTGTPAEAMMRNDTSQEINGAASAMQHYNGTAWKNYVNYYPCSTSVCSYPAGAGALALYEFTSDASDTCTTYDGTVNGSVSFASSGKFGNGSAEFSAVSEYITLPTTLRDQIDGNQPFTVSLWFNLTALSSQNESIIVSCGGGGNVGINMGVTNTTIYGQTVNASASQRTNYSSTATTGTWYHLVFVVDYSSSSQKLYLNGSLEATTATLDLSASWGTPIDIGGYWDQINYPWDGYISQLRFFNTALSASQISLLYNERNC